MTLRVAGAACVHGCVSLLVCVVLWAQEELRTLKYSILKDKLLSVVSSRAAQLQWLTEFLVFVGSHHSTLTEYPNLTFQYAVNQVGGGAVELPRRQGDVDEFPAGM